MFVGRTDEASAGAGDPVRERAHAQCRIGRRMWDGEGFRDVALGLAHATAEQCHLGQTARGLPLGPQSGMATRAWKTSEPL